MIKKRMVFKPSNDVNLVLPGKLSRNRELNIKLDKYRFFVSLIKSIGWYDMDFALYRK